MNAPLQMEAVSTIVLTLMGVSSAAVTQGTSWMKMTAMVRILSLWLYSESETEYRALSVFMQMLMSV